MNIQLDALRIDLIGAAVAIACGFAGTVLMRALARRTGFVSSPNPLIPQHTRPTAYLGGVGVAIGIGAGLAALRLLGGDVPAGVVLAGALYLALGVIDDLVVLEPAVKFGLQALVAALAVGTGVRAPLTDMAALDAAISWLWLVTLVNAFNFTDVCDGLLGSLGVVMFAALAVLDPAHAGAALVVAAACLGFLVLNFPPASIFLGDAGSHLLGFLAGAFALAAVPRGGTSPVLMWCAGALIVGVPLFELGFLTAVRVRKGLPWWRGSPDHFSLRLQAAGLTRRSTDLVACAFAAAWAAGGLALAHLHAPGIAALAGGLLVSAAGAAAYLVRHEVALPARPAGAARSTSEPHGAHGASATSLTGDR